MPRSTPDAADPSSLTLGLLAAVCAFSVSLSVRAILHTDTSDFLHLWIAARAWLAGNDPYQVVGSTADWHMPLLYPFPAVLVAVPFALLPIQLATAFFTALSAGALTYASFRYLPAGPSRLLFLSAPFVQAIAVAQWSPLLLAAALMPAGGWLLACKPTTAIWLFAGWPSWRTAFTTGLFMLASLLILPTWPASWWQATRVATYATMPVQLFGGPLLLLAWLKWRRPEARILGTMALVPHTTLLYEALPLFLVPQTWRQGWCLVASSWLAWLLHVWGEPYGSQLEAVRAGGYGLLVLLYLPCLVLILRQPNESLARRDLVRPLRRTLADRADQRP